MNLPPTAHKAAAPRLSIANQADRRAFLKTGAATAAGLLLAGCDRKPVSAPPAGPVVGSGPDQEMVPVPEAEAQAPAEPEVAEAKVEAEVKEWNLSELAPPPDWSRLDAWQGTISAEDFRHLLENVLTDGTAFYATVEQLPDRALIRTSTAVAGAPRYELRFAANPPVAAASGAARYWRKVSEMGPAPSADRPLEGVRVALDPGHIGGEWAKMEGRWYHMNADQPVVSGTAAAEIEAEQAKTAVREPGQEGSPAEGKAGKAEPVLPKPVMEGELTLKTAEVLRPILEEMGAIVTLVREKTEPLTDEKPAQLREAARQSLMQSKGPLAVLSEWQIEREAERLFYRTSEIRARGRRVNEVLKPDLVVCLHYNAEPWGKDAGKPVFTTRNHLHILAHGCLGPAEFFLDDQRLDALLRLVQRIPDEEILLCDSVARHLAEATGLPPFTYLGNSARQVNDNPYLWARNLLANRVYHCPVVFPEPYVMNNHEVYQRIQAGNYEGEKEVAGKMRRSIFREYAHGVAAGLAEVFRTRRG